MRLILSAAVSALVLAVPASAEVARQARLSGRSRVVYVHAAGTGYAGGTSAFRWSAVPGCAHGACTTTVQSLRANGTPSATLVFTFDGTTYQWRQRANGVETCTDSTGKIGPISKAYDVTILSRFRVTRMSDSGRALAFKGTSSTRFTANALGRAHGCGYATSTERYVGHAISTP